MKSTARQELKIIVQNIIKQMESKDWTFFISGLVSSVRPNNFKTKKYYRGFNSIFLNFVQIQKSYTSSKWLTFRQVQELGGKVKKGSKAAPIFFYKPIETTTIKKDDKEKTIKYIFKKFSVFNADQIEGIDFTDENLFLENRDQRLSRIENFIKNTGAKIVEGEFSPSYFPTSDFIQMPAPEHCSDIEKYYSILLHELTHWSGAKRRLNRKFGLFKTDDYAFEELVAELGSAFLSSYFGLKIENNYHPHYLKHYLKILKNDYKKLWQASSLAQKAFDYLLEIGGEIKQAEIEEKVA